MTWKSIISCYNFPLSIDKKFNRIHICRVDVQKESLSYHLRIDWNDGSYTTQEITISNRSLNDVLGFDLLSYSNTTLLSHQNRCCHLEYVEFVCEDFICRSVWTVTYSWVLLVIVLSILFQQHFKLFENLIFKRLRFSLTVVSHWIWIYVVAITDFVLEIVWLFFLHLRYWLRFVVGTQVSSLLFFFAKRFLLWRQGFCMLGHFNAMVLIIFWRRFLLEKIHIILRRCFMRKIAFFLRRSVLIRYFEEASKFFDRHLAFRKVWEKMISKHLSDILTLELSNVGCT